MATSVSGAGSLFAQIRTAPLSGGAVFFLGQLMTMIETGLLEVG
jgi:hypothetical protein